MNAGEMGAAGRSPGSHFHGARMVSLMALVTILLRLSLLCLFLPPIRF